MVIPNLYGGLFVLVRLRPFLQQFPLQGKREGERVNWGKEPSLSFSVSLSTHLYFSIIPSFSLIGVCLYLYDLSSGSCPFSHLEFSSSSSIFLLFVKMMKRARKVAMNSSPSSSQLLVGEEARARFKHQALLKDYEDLLRETEAKKRKLQKTMQKNLMLTAEVKFLRRKYKSFARNPSQETPCRLKKLPCQKPSPSATFAQPQNSVSNATLSRRDKNPRAKKAETPSTCALFDLNKVVLSEC